MEGRFIRLEPLDPARHAADQFAAHRAGDPKGLLWAHLPYGPFDTLEDYTEHLARQAASEDPLFFALVSKDDGKAGGVMSLMRISPEHGVAEVGHICLAPGMRRTPGGTEAIRLFGGLLFDELGYRRFEWKCDNANQASRRAASRFGFAFEGVFRQHMVVKDRNRDTAWFAMTDADWPRLRSAMDAWLSPDNFDARGHQRQSLEALQAAAHGDRERPTGVVL
nr:GNAT family protein [Acuticoccus mangrovi]